MPGVRDAGAEARNSGPMRETLVVSRRPNRSVAICAAAATLAFLFVLVIAGILFRAILILLDDVGVPIGALPDVAIIGILTAAAVVSAYVPSRSIYMNTLDRRQGSRELLRLMRLRSDR